MRGEEPRLCHFPVVGPGLFADNRSKKMHGVR